MNDKSTLEITGGANLSGTLATYSEEMTEELARAMFEFGGRVMNEAIQLTPIDTGELRSRAFVEGPFVTDDEQYYAVVVGYEKHTDKTDGDYYAVPVHERTDVHHPRGQAKFLEEPFKRLESEFLRDLAEAAKRVKPDD